MAIRELVTLFTFKVDQTGVNQYKAAVGGLKEMAVAAGKFFGIAFGLEKIYGFADGLMDAAKEANKVVYQIQRLAREGDDLSNIQDTLLDSALRLHVAYGDIADSFKEMLRESQDLGISQEAVLAATENIWKSFRVERLSGEQTKEVLSTLNMVFRRGGLKSERAVNTLYDQSTELMKTLMEAYGVTTVESMVKLAKAGQLTTDSIVEHLSRQNARLNADFAKAPVKLSQALTDIYSRLTVMAAKLWKLLDNSVYIAKGVTWAFDLIVGAVKRLVDMLGGAEDAIRLLGIALSVVVAVKISVWLAAAVKGMELLRAATWRAMLPWLLWAAAIAAVALAIEDVYVWMKGGKSIIGSWVGPFSDFQEQMEKIVGPFEDWKTAFITVKDIVVEWSSWFAKSLDSSVAAIQSFGFELGKALGIHALVNLFKVDLNTIQTSWNDTWTYIGQVYTTWYGTLSGWIVELKNKFLEAWTGIKEGFINAFNYLISTFEEWKNKILGGIQAVIDKVKSLFGLFGGTPAPATDTVPKSGPNVPAFPGAIPFTQPPPGAIVPGVGAGGTVTDNRQATVNQTNNITVMTSEQQDIANSIKQAMPQLADDMVNKMARELTGASPRAERATQ